MSAPEEVTRSSPLTSAAASVAASHETEPPAAIRNAKRSVASESSSAIADVRGDDLAVAARGRLADA
ncbi:MAG: hypothetical protein C4B59_06055 [Candidatus Methanogaster sp.]|uniref:Uncharacterized protein n=1 Tax=Candidatus Methanogaster sp. TaxID=3386292 RepID=A0AC61L3N6_9EURY|nr:MAG: hypothetical protein C4B59_06055 [ANME-2 cluster archaeon]